MVIAAQLRFLPNYNHLFTSPSPSWRSSSQPKSTIIINSQSKSQLQASSSSDVHKTLMENSLLVCPLWVRKAAANMHYYQFYYDVEGQRLTGQGVYHSDKSFGAASYLIVHPEGNILIDSPWYTERLAGKIEKMGGVRYMFFTHNGDVADHEKWSKRFNCVRVLHSTEVNASTSDVEMKLEGCGPWSLRDDIQLIHTPGHTEKTHGVAAHWRRVAFKDIEEKNASLKAFSTAKKHANVF